MSNTIDIDAAVESRSSGIIPVFNPSTEEQITASQKALPTWIEWASVIAIVMLTCFAFTQCGLMLQAWCLLRKGFS